MKIIPNYHPPSDYRRPTKTQEKVYVPVNDYPEINFSMITNLLSPNLLTLLSFLFWQCMRHSSEDAACLATNPKHSTHTLLYLLICID